MVRRGLPRNDFCLRAAAYTGDNPLSHFSFGLLTFDPHHPRSGLRLFIRSSDSDFFSHWSLVISKFPPPFCLARHAPRPHNPGTRYEPAPPSPASFLVATPKKSRLLERRTSVVL